MTVTFRITWHSITEAIWHTEPNVVTGGSCSFGVRRDSKVITPWLPGVLVEPTSYQSAVVQKIEFLDIQVSCACNRRELKPELHVSLLHPFGTGDPDAAGMVCA